jgi:beta-glucosidase/6-phospho-beta-glucosidase/beta-galactosidase
VPWYRVQPSPNEFDWSWTDEVLRYLVEELGITPIVDLMHYGCPFWLRREFASEEYAQAVARYAAAFAARYARWVRWYTPLNEPLVNAMMCGQRGLWPPYLRGQRGYVTLVRQLVAGMRATAAALKAVDPGCLLVWVEATGLVRSARPDLAALVAEDQAQNYLIYDLLTGRVRPDHPLFPWLVRHGAPPDQLAAWAAAPLVLDVLGLNFYPQWSTREAGVNAAGQLAYRLVEREGPGFAALMSAYYQRYGRPILITETSAHGTDARRLRWLTDSLAAVKAVRAQGVPVCGYTWFPLFTMVDWRYRFGTQPPEAYHLDLGLYRLNPAPGPRWVATPLVAAFQAARAHPTESIGPLGAAPAWKE